MDATRRRFVRSRSATIQGELIRFAEDATVQRETRIPADSSLPLLRNQPKPLRLCRLNGRLTLGASSFRDALNAPYTTQQPLSRFARTHSPTHTNMHALTCTTGRVLASEKEEAPGAYEIVARGLRAYQIAADCLNFSSNARLRRTTAMKKFPDARLTQ